MSLDDLRKEIDKIDESIIKLLNERSELVHNIGIIKKKEGLEIYAPEREDKLLKNLALKAQGGLIPEKSIRAIYREIMSASIALEEDIVVSYLGPQGTWTHQAAIQKFGNSVKYSPQPSFFDVFDRVERGDANYGVVPIENSTEGAVTGTLDLFVDSPLKIYGQLLMPIKNNLMANCSKDQITQIYSHPQIIAQCKQWLNKNFHGIQTIEKSSSALAAEIVSKEKNSAVLGGSLLARLYNLNIIEKSIQDISTNTTRFLVISKKTCPPTGDDRTSIMFALNDEPGSLYKALKPFKKETINMSRIESRPSKSEAWKYYFFVDILGYYKSEEIVKVFSKLKKHCSFFKIIGSYPNVSYSD